MPILETLKGAWELASGLGSALSKMSALEAKQTVLDLQNFLWRIQTEAFELQQQNPELRDKIRRMEEEARAAGQVVHEDNICWRQTATGREGPLCPACYDNGGKEISLTVETGRGPTYVPYARTGSTRRSTTRHLRSISVAYAVDRPI
jgi:hypothetical protein